MAERIVVKLDRKFRAQFFTADPEDIHSNMFEPVENVHQLTPYGMLLTSLASCTAQVMHTYAMNHDMKLTEVEMQMTFQRVFRDDCEDCDESRNYKEEIEERILLIGDLSSVEREKLLRSAHYCPVYKILSTGIKVNSRLIEGKIDDDPPEPVNSD